MTGSPELLEYFLVEATEYIDAIDQLVSSPQLTPETNALLASARALRGSASMANAESISEIGLALEQLSLRLRDSSLAWTEDLFHAIRGSVADLRSLVRHVRIWSEEDEARAQAASLSLRRFIPADARRPTPPSSDATTPVFVALQTAAIAAELDAFANAPDERRSLDDAVARTRTLRGIAGISDYPPLAEVADSVERFARTLVPDMPPHARETELFRSAAEVMRDAADQLRATGRCTLGESGVARFARALEALEVRDPDPTTVPIDSLFYGDSAGHVVAPTAAPTESPATRLHRELMTRSEHLRRLVGDARRAHDPVSRQRAASTLREALKEAASLTAKFGAHQARALFSDAAAATDLLGAEELDAIDGACGLAMAPFTSIDELERRLAVVQRARVATPKSTPVIAPRITPPFSAPATPPKASPVIAPPPPPPVLRLPLNDSAPPQVTASGPAPAEPITDPEKVPQPRAAARPSPLATGSHVTHSAPPPPPSPLLQAKPTPLSGDALKALLTTGLNGLRSLETEMLSEPIAFEGEVVDVDALVYRGNAALDRAIEIRDELVSRQATPDTAQLEELYDLIDLARAV